MEDKDLKIERQKFQMHTKGYKDIADAIKEAREPEVNEIGENVTMVISGRRGPKGEPGEKPSKEELIALIEPRLPDEDKLKSIIIPLIPKPIKGEDGKSIKGPQGKPGRTPIKGVDYFDGKPGKTPVKGIDYNDGKPGKNGSPDSPEEIKRKILMLEADKWFPIEWIKGDFSKLYMPRASRGGSSNGSANSLRQLIDVDYSQLQQDARGNFILGSTPNSVIGPVSSEDLNIPIFNGITGKLIKDSGVKLSDLAPALTSDENYVTDDEKIILGNTSGTNSGDNATNSQYSGLATSKQDALGFTPENVSNKSTSVATDGSSDTKYPSVKAIKDYADGLVAGLLDYRGGYDASVNTFPASGGSGTAGAVLKGDMWIISVAGTLGGTAVQVGDSVIANVDTPAQTAGNWNVLNSNISYVPENVANKENTTLDTSTTKYPTNRLAKEYSDSKVADAINDGTTTVAPSQNAVFDALALKAPLESPALTGNPTAPTQAENTNNTTLATTSYVDNSKVNGWISANETWTYASATTITIPSDGTTKYQKGDKIKLTQTTVKYFYVVAVTSTLLTITGGSSYTLTNAAISNNYYSKLPTVIGFPSYFTYTPSITAPGGTAPSYANIAYYFTIVGDFIDVNIDLSNSTGGTAGAGLVPMFVTIPVIGTTSVIGYGIAYEESGTMGSLIARNGGDGTMYFHLVNFSNILAADQSSTARNLFFNLRYRF